MKKYVYVSSWDNVWVHGENLDAEYIKHKENQAALRAIAPLLREALFKRKETFEKKLDKLRQIIALANKAVMLLRAKIAAERGNVAILPNNQCTHYGKN
jgi:hypothetical protein